MHKNIIIPQLCHFRLFIDTCASENTIVSKDLTFYFPWYNVLCWTSHITYSKTIFFSPFHSLVLEKSTCCFIIILLYIERKWLLKRKLTTILLLKSKWPGKFPYYWWKYWNSKKTVELSKILIEIIISKHFTSPKQRAASRKLFSPPPDKSFLRI